MRKEMDIIKAAGYTIRECHKFDRDSLKCKDSAWRCSVRGKCISTRLEIFRSRKKLTKNGNGDTLDQWRGNGSKEKN